MAETRTVEDLRRTVRSLCRHFKTDVVFIIGSQAVLVGWPDAPAPMTISDEIDAYPGNFKEWEKAMPGALASEEINALFGWQSNFHEAFGFYIDGVDDTTAKLPPGWQDRAVVMTVEDGPATLRAIAPSTVDMVVAKLHRLNERDRDYIEACHAARPLDLALVAERMADSLPPLEILEAARAFLTSLPGAPAAMVAAAKSLRQDDRGAEVEADLHDDDQSM